MQKTQGFTLLELIIIIIIIAILAVLPFINWPGTVINIDAQAQLIASDIRFTQSLSMARSERYRIVKLSSTSYQILNSASNPVILANGTTTANLNAGLSFLNWGNLTNNLIAFDGRGTPYLDTATPGTPLASGTTYIITITGGSNNKTITISPITGRVIVQ